MYDSVSSLSELWWGKVFLHSFGAKIFPFLPHTLQNSKKKTFFIVLGSCPDWNFKASCKSTQCLSILGEPKNGTHKNFALQNCNICKQSSENCPVNLSNRSSTYVITSLTKLALNLPRMSRHLYHSFCSHVWCVKVLWHSNVWKNCWIKLNDWQAEFQRSKLFWNILLTNIWHFESIIIFVRSVFFGSPSLLVIQHFRARNTLQSCLSNSFSGME